MSTIQVHRLGSVRAPVGAAVAGLVAVGVVALVDPNEPGHYPTCPFFALTGHFCPGCGTLRAVHALAHGDVAAALGSNLLAVLAVLPLLVVWVRWVRRSWTGTARTAATPAVLIWGLLVVVCVFTLLRNLPVGAALAP